MFSPNRIELNSIHEKILIFSTQKCPCPWKRKKSDQVLVFVLSCFYLRADGEK